MSLLLRSFVAAACVMLFAGLTAILSFDVAAAALGWPGLIVVNAVCARFGIYLRESPTWTWMIPSLLIDLLLYTALFFVAAKLWRISTAKLGDKRFTQQDGLSPTTNDQRSTTHL
jgi:hypothetical protein